jgi:hypothetical protein
MSSFDAVGTLYIPIEEWHEYLRRKFPFLGSGQFVLADPKDVGNGELEIQYAMGTDDTHPNDWAVKPEWMKVKK